VDLTTRNLYKKRQEATLIPEEPTQYEATIALLRERRESRLPTPYDILTRRVRQELQRRSANPCFNARDVKIDDLLTADDLEPFDESLVVRVVLEQGLRYLVCPPCKAHPTPRIRVNGKWLEPEESVLPELYAHDIIRAEHQPCYSCINPKRGTHDDAHPEYH